MMKTMRIPIILWSFFIPTLLPAQVLLCPDLGKTTIELPGDPFLHYFNNLNWVKFAILKEPYDANIVYFQDSNTQRLHVNFATQCLTPLQGLSSTQFDLVSLFAQGQQVVLGAVLLPFTWEHGPPLTEYGIQLVRHDPYTREETLHWLQIVQAAIKIDPNAQVFYMPTYEQETTTMSHQDWFAQQGFPVGSIDQWLIDQVIYAPGWTLGRLHYVPTDQIQTAYSTGDLLPSDILLVDRIPSEVPHVAGIVSLSAATPNSHVAILSRTFGIPFVYLATASARQKAWNLEGRRVALRAIQNINLTDAESLTPTEVNELLALKQPTALDIQPIQSAGTFVVATDDLIPDDINRVGGKAANYGMLRRSISQNCPPAAAITFDLWTGFMEQDFGGQTLRQAIAAKLAPYTTYPPMSMVSLERELSDIQDWIKDNDLTQFTATQQQAILDALTDPAYGFNPQQKIRFRSSTNVEDSEVFSGAGLYDSFSGCLADNLDSDAQGPCACDPQRDKERGVFQAIRKVFASFYNRNAFLERLRHGIDEDQVGMAILVHHSFPDEIEWANGVAVYTHSGNWRQLELVTQLGAVSVTNAKPGVIPEQVKVAISSSDASLDPSVKTYSNLVPLGQTVMQWEEDYRSLSQLCLEGAREFERVTGKTLYTLDFEYKRTAPDGQLVVKQIRQVPTPTEQSAQDLFLVAEPLFLETFQGGCVEIYANHRLKSQWKIQANSGWLDQARLSSGLLNHIDMTYHEQGTLYTLSNVPDQLPQARHEVSFPDDYRRFISRDHWRLDQLDNPRDMTLNATLTAPALQSGCPLVTLADLDITVKARYDNPVCFWNNLSQEIEYHFEDSIRLCEPEPLLWNDQPQQHLYTSKEMQVEISYTWGAFDLCATYPIKHWQQTIITGLTSEPLVLTGYYSQTYGAEHHNMSEHFLFEPRLEPNLSPILLQELNSQNISQVYLFLSSDNQNHVFIRDHR